MPKYVAISLLTTAEGFVQVGEVFDLDDPNAEKLLLESGHIKAATKMDIKNDPGPLVQPEPHNPVSVYHSQIPTETEQPKKASNAKKS